jgi:hypothetical protein
MPGVTRLRKPISDTRSPYDQQFLQIDGHLLFNSRRLASLRGQSRAECRNEKIQLCVMEHQCIGPHWIRTQ